MLKLLCEFVPLAAMLGLYLGGALELMGRKSYDPVGPCLFPLFMSILAIILMAVLIIRSVRKQTFNDKMTVEEESFTSYTENSKLGEAYVAADDFTAMIQEQYATMGESLKSLGVIE